MYVSVLSLKEGREVVVEDHHEDAGRGGIAAVGISGQGRKRFDYLL